MKVTANKWWFTMLWRSHNNWIVSPMHRYYGASREGSLYSKGYDTLADAEHDWVNTSGTSHLGLVNWSVRSENFYLAIDYAPERPSYEGFTPPEVVNYELDLE